MAYCKYLKIKLNHTFECKKTKKKITLKSCSNCRFKEYKSNGNQIKNIADNKKFKQQKIVKIKPKSNKLVKLERKRFSLFSMDTNHCYFCHSTHQLTWHEIFRGRNRTNSMKYGLCLRMCLKCHKKYQDDPFFNDFWHKKGQEMFEQTYLNLDFLEIFKKNYK